MSYWQFCQSYINYQTAIVLFASVLLLLLYRRNQQGQNLPPGPIRIPFIGNILSLITQLYFSGDEPEKVLATMAKKYGDVFCLSAGSKFIVVMNSCRTVKEAFNNLALNDRPQSKLFDDTSLDEGLPATSGKSWKYQRKLTIHAFRNFGVGRNSFEENIAKEADTLIKAMAEHEGKPFDPQNLFSRCITNVICSITFGKQYEHNDPEFERFMTIIHRVTVSMGSGGLVLFLPVMRYILPKQYKDCVDSLTDFVDFAKPIIDDHEKEFDGDNINDILDLFLNEIEQADNEKKKYIHKKSLTATAVFLFLVGTDAPSITIRWVCLYMIMYPEVQVKIQQEIDSVVGRNQLPKWNDRSALPYTEAVLREIQRIQTILPLGTAHIASADTELCGYSVPQGSIIVPNVWAVHNDERVWIKPDRFEPERFLDENGELRHREELMQFGAGHRICIGESLAKMELFMFFTYMMHQFNISLPQEVQSYSLKGTGGITVAPVNYQILVEKR